MLAARQGSRSVGAGMRTLPRRGLLRFDAVKLGLQGSQTFEGCGVLLRDRRCHGLHHKEAEGGERCSEVCGCDSSAGSTTGSVPDCGGVPACSSRGRSPSASCCCSSASTECGSGG